MYLVFSALTLKISRSWAITSFTGRATAKLNNVMVVSVSLLRWIMPFLLIFIRREPRRLVAQSTCNPQNKVTFSSPRSGGLVRGLCCRLGVFGHSVQRRCDNERHTPAF